MRYLPPNAHHSPNASCRGPVKQSSYVGVSLLVHCLAAHWLVAQAVPPISVEFDRFKNVTVVRMEEVSLAEDVELNAFYSFAGQSQRKPQAGVALHFSRRGEDWEYLSYHEAVFLLDDRTRVDIGGGSHSGHIGSGYVLEQIFWNLNRSQATQIARAKKVEMRVGTSEFVWSDSLRRGFQQLVADLVGSKTPAGTSPRDRMNTPTRRSTMTRHTDQGSSTVRTDGIDFPYPGYLNNISRQIALRFDPSDRDPTLRAEVMFLLHRDGSISNVRFLKRSGEYALDVEVQSAIEASASARAFGPLPAGFTDDVLPIVFATGTASTHALTQDAYFEFQVDKTALAVAGNTPPPYPPMLRSARVEGKVLAQFVVDTTGVVDLSTFKVLESSHELFSEAVRDAVAHMRFYPAERSGVKVRQVVQQPFVFGLNE